MSGDQEQTQTGGEDVKGWARQQLDLLCAHLFERLLSNFPCSRLLTESEGSPSPPTTNTNRSFPTFAAQQPHGRCPRSPRGNLQCFLDDIGQPFVSIDASLASCRRLGQPTGELHEASAAPAALETIEILTAPRRIYPPRAIHSWSGDFAASHPFRSAMHRVAALPPHRCPHSLMLLVLLSRLKDGGTQLLCVLHPAAASSPGCCKAPRPTTKSQSKEQTEVSHMQRILSKLLSRLRYGGAQLPCPIRLPAAASPGCCTPPTTSAADRVDTANGNPSQHTAAARVEHPSSTATYIECIEAGVEILRSQSFKAPTWAWQQRIVPLGAARLPTPKATSSNTTTAPTSTRTPYPDS
ncbi:hypothetical protein BCR34DRAFT_588964 [Clohesyomyces aquaticus]|uniref:Uncharacterized protein n=1 Tax=Clohesyomyces aquaticus TaxID=1231657 RepID=A0A1Y1ZI55_9PLEO|nr:hypothetical protein BCR34DRAFT_588964 [Clohesyomyces aquaticus]